MNLFVDANIFLDFYHFSDDDLNELRKLVDLMTKGKITLVVTTQIIDEVQRNRDNRVADAYNRFKDSKTDISLPQICKSYPEYNKIKASLRELKRLNSDLDSKLTRDIRERTLKADETINQLFGKANLIDCAKYFEQAKSRYDLGNPPGKEGSYGDSLNWTTLIGELNEGDDLFFVSDDKDYKSPLDEYTMNSFLINEWKTKKGSEIFFYTKLSDFFSEHYKDIQLKVEGEKNELIGALANSPNFAYTHSVIANLAAYASFTDEQVRELASIAVTNSQVYSILDDPDLKDFYERLLENKEDVVDSQIWTSIQKRLMQSDLAADEEDIPF